MNDKICESFSIAPDFEAAVDKAADLEAELANSVTEFDQYICTSPATPTRSPRPASAIRLRQSCIQFYFPGIKLRFPYVTIATMVSPFQAVWTIRIHHSFRGDPNQRDQSCTISYSQLSCSFRFAGIGMGLLSVWHFRCYRLDVIIR